MCELVLRTERLVLKRPILSDADRIQKLMDNWNVVRFLARPPFPYTRENAESYIENVTAEVARGALSSFAITHQAKLLGMIGFGRRNRRDTIGYWLGEPYWNQGFMSEALMAAVSHFFEISSADELTSGIFEDNTASLHIQKRVGFAVMGTSMIDCVARGERIRHVDMKLTRKRFEELKR